MRRTSPTAQVISTTSSINIRRILVLSGMGFMIVVAVAIKFSH